MDGVRKFKKEYHNPIELIKSWWPDADISHITYDPEVKSDCWIVKQCGHDGTLYFTVEMLQSSLLPLVNKSTSWLEPKDWTKIKDIKYTIGKMSHVTVFGKVHLGISKTRKYPGQRERVRIPVKCEYVYS